MSSAQCRNCITQPNRLFTFSLRMCGQERETSDSKASVDVSVSHGRQYLRVNDLQKLTAQPQQQSQFKVGMATKLTNFHPSIEERTAAGKALRDRVSRKSQGKWKPAAKRPDPIELLKHADEGRLPELLPI